MIGLSPSPQGNVAAVIQNPTHGQVQDAAVKPFLSQMVEPFYGGQILVKTRLLKFRVFLAQIISLIFPRGGDFTRLQAPAQGPISH